MIQMYQFRFILIATIMFVGLGVFVNRLQGDAIVVTQAMKASTIAEVFVEQGQVRVEIEVGVVDVEAFRNVLPDELYEKVTGKTNAIEERLKEFLERDWLLWADGDRLTGSVERIELKKRVTRDEITGEPAASQPEDAEIVIRVELSYSLEDESQSISIRPP